MQFSDQEFRKNLESGFIDRHLESSRAYLPKLLTNNRAQSRKVLTTLERQLASCKSFNMSVAFITTSGVASLINVLDQLQMNNVPGRILASQYQNFTQPEALRRLLQLSNIQLRISVEYNLHSKGYLFERENKCWSLIVGSSNLTADALSRNAEWNLYVSALESSSIVEQTRAEFGFEFQRGVVVNSEFIDAYESSYERARLRRSFGKDYFTGELGDDENLSDGFDGVETEVVEPNRMQKEALDNLSSLRSLGKKRALLVSATGTGKTYLSAFDSNSFGAKRLLFVVHRRNIAEAALKSFRNIYRNSKTLGVYSGDRKEVDRDFVFCTVQTLSKSENLLQFSREAFDYIVIDETHRAGAESYQRVIDYFEPKFLLGMTATPERTDGYDVFSLFNHTIAYEIRLHQALEEEMLCPFHYYGVTDLTINNEVVEESSDFNLLTADERVTRILEKAEFYGTDSGETRGLVFCSRKAECEELAEKFRSRGLRAIALTGDASEGERLDAIRKLELEDGFSRLDYIFTVDIFNEGIDIPRVNQVIMLRPTQSAIIFVQQMGRGLRKCPGKDYLTIIDFIGNYTNNFLVPIALYGDRSYNKDRLRNLLNGGSSTIPGTSTVNFDQISKDRIYKAIDSANMKRAADLRLDYQLLKFELGRSPMMMDFLEHGSRDPFLYVEANRSFFNFAERQEESLQGALTAEQKKLLEVLSREINNGVRPEESLILKEIIQTGSVHLEILKSNLKKKYGVVSEESIESAVHGLNLMFVTERCNGKMLPVGEVLQLTLIQKESHQLRAHPDLAQCLSNLVFKKYLLDGANYSIAKYDESYSKVKERSGFVLGRKYSRKDVFRVLNWKKNPVAQNVGGYIISEGEENCPIFVTYHKSEDISESINYEDYFINNSTLSWMSKSNRTLNSSDVASIRNAPHSGMRIPLFVKKSDDEGSQFYYLGDLDPIVESFEQSTILNDQGNQLPVVKIEFKLQDPLEDSLFHYLTSDGVTE